MAHYVGTISAVYRVDTKGPLILLELVTCRQNLGLRLDAMVGIDGMLIWSRQWCPLDVEKALSLKCVSSGHDG